ncbi:hypothetical protein K2173_005495 [Erythroxylum novogranatense]|uniref:Small auxin up regulated protein n=1 Tax=Erythroxylum novogranatense TaxID=1862640 RepID=A0AAV8SK08_9ROSI|nr:hypothetical protein K2173_005495 [Erythroxylum novogranatense]
MDILKGRWKQNLFRRIWDRCRSMGANRCKKCPTATMKRSNTWHRTDRSTIEEDDDDHHQQHCCRMRSNKNMIQVAPEGCFSVYVGPQKQRFVVKTKFASHPLFKMLLEDAELEYGFNSEGPLLLPCDVDLFYKILAEMDNSDEEVSSPIGCSSFVMCSPRRASFELISNKSCGAYRILPPSPLLKLNKF